MQAIITVIVFKIFPTLPKHYKNTFRHIAEKFEAKSLNFLTMTQTGIDWLIIIFNPFFANSQQRHFFHEDNKVTSQILSHQRFSQVFNKLKKQKNKSKSTFSTRCTYNLKNVNRNISISSIGIYFIGGQQQQGWHLSSSNETPTCFILLMQCFYFSHQNKNIAKYYKII